MSNFIYASRASTVLFNFLISNKIEKCFAIPANCCPVIPLTLWKANCTFIIVDIDPKTLFIDEGLVLELLKDTKVEGIIDVYSYGYEVNREIFYKSIKNFTEENIVVADKCLCVPAITSLGENTDLVLYSTGYQKIVDIGFGGFGILNDSSYTYNNIALTYNEKIENTVFDKIKSKMASGDIVRNEVAMGDWLNSFYVGDSYCHIINFSLNHVVEKIVEHKERINLIYSDLNTISLPDGYHLWRYSFHIENRDALISKLRKNNFLVSDHYQCLAPTFGPLYGSGVYFNKKEQIVNLFNNFLVTPEDALNIVDLINDYEYKRF